MSTRFDPGGLRLIGRETMTAPRRRRDRSSTPIAPGTIILLTTKVNASAAALTPIADLVRDDTVIVCVQNGLDSEGIARRAVGGRCLVLRAITQFGAIFQAPGRDQLHRVRLHPARGRPAQRRDRRAC